MEMLQSESDFVGTLTKKLAPPLVTLLSSEPEVQYVALRNINLIVQKRPDILKHEMKVFFVKYNDPIYVKLEKLDIMIRLASQVNIAQVLSELKEYATEVDVDFVRKAVRAIGRCAIKVEPSAERCVSTLLDLIQTKVMIKKVYFRNLYILRHKSHIFHFIQSTCLNYLSLVSLSYYLNFTIFPGKLRRARSDRGDKRHFPQISQ